MVKSATVIFVTHRLATVTTRSRVYSKTVNSQTTVTAIVTDICISQVLKLSLAQFQPSHLRIKSKIIWYWGQSAVRFFTDQWNSLRTLESSSLLAHPDWVNRWFTQPCTHITLWVKDTARGDSRGPCGDDKFCEEEQSEVALKLHKKLEPIDILISGLL